MKHIAKISRNYTCTHVIGIGIPKLTTGLTLSLVGGNDAGGGNKDVHEANPEEELVHGAGLEKGVVGIDGIGDGLEGVHVSGDADEVGGDEAHHGEHGRAAVLDLGLAEPGEEGLVGLGQVERVVLELLPAEVDASVHVVPDGVGGDGGRSDTVARRCESASAGNQRGENARFHLIAFTFKQVDGVRKPSWPKRRGRHRLRQARNASLFSVPTR